MTDHERGRFNARITLVLLDPVRDTPTVWTIAGGAILLIALGLRYYPRKRTIPIHGS